MKRRVSDFIYKSLERLDQLLEHIVNQAMSTSDVGQSLSKVVRLENLRVDLLEKYKLEVVTLQIRPAADPVFEYADVARFDLTKHSKLVPTVLARIEPKVPVPAVPELAILGHTEGDAEK